MVRTIATCLLAACLGSLIALWSSGSDAGPSIASRFRIGDVTATGDDAIYNSVSIAACTPGARMVTIGPYPGIETTVESDGLSLVLPNPEYPSFGLIFDESCRLRTKFSDVADGRIAENGMIRFPLVRKGDELFAEKAGVRAKDSSGAVWTSQMVRLGEQEVFAFFKDESSVTNHRSSAAQ